MRHANNSTSYANSYSELLETCRHSKLRAALELQMPVGLRHAASGGVTCPSLAVSAGTKAYLFVAGASILSLFSIILSGIPA